MKSKLILHIDENHPLLLEGLKKIGYENHLAYTTPLATLLNDLDRYEGIVIRSRFPINRAFMNKAPLLKFIARVGAGLENIDLDYAHKKKITLIAAPEGNRNAVGEHTLGMLLALMNKLRQSHLSIQNGRWEREEHRGWELEGKTVGIIGYGNTGKSFAQKLKGFDVEVLCYDIKPGLGDENANQVSLQKLQKKAQILSLHIPQSPETIGMIDKNFIDNMSNPFWFLNSARGKAVITEDLVDGIEKGKILGAGLDVLEYESSSFESIFNQSNRPKALDYLLSSDRVLLSPHVGGWTRESHVKLAQTILDKIVDLTTR
jgi:D-3-phosphoglycerate dehydrogenase